MCLVIQLCLSLCGPMNYVPPGSSVCGIFQARILEWVAISSSRESYQPRDQTHVSCIIYHQHHLGSPAYMLAMPITSGFNLSFWNSSFAYVNEFPSHSKDFYYLLDYLTSLKLPGSPFFFFLLFYYISLHPLYHLYEDSKDFSQFDDFVMMSMSFMPVSFLCHCPGHLCVLMPSWKGAGQVVESLSLQN